MTEADTYEKDLDRIEQLDENEQLFIDTVEDYETIEETEEAGDFEYIYEHAFDKGSNREWDSLGRWEKNLKSQKLNAEELDKIMLR